MVQSLRPSVLSLTLLFSLVFPEKTSCTYFGRSDRNEALSHGTHISFCFYQPHTGKGSKTCNPFTLTLPVVEPLGPMLVLSGVSHLLHQVEISWLLFLQT